MALSANKLPLVFHLCTEIPASISFALHPSGTLPIVQPFAHPIIRQYALLLSSSNLIAGAFVFCSDDELHHTSIERIVTAALALYHLGPVMRALNRCRNKISHEEWLAHPMLHLIVHMVCATSLGWKVLWLM